MNFQLRMPVAWRVALAAASIILICVLLLAWISVSDRTFKVHVIDASGQPLAGAIATAQNCCSGQTSLGSIVYSALGDRSCVTGADGRCGVFAPDDCCQIRVDESTHAWTYLNLKPKAKELEAKLYDYGRVEGVVLRAGRRVGGAQMERDSGIFLPPADVNGAFAVEVRPFNSTLCAWDTSAGVVWVSRETRFDVRPKETTKVTLELHPAPNGSRFCPR